MKWKCCCLVLFITICDSVKSQDKKMDFWKGTMIRDSSSMEVSFEFEFYGKESMGYFNAPSQKASGIPLDSVSQTKDSISFQLMSDPVTYFKGRISEKHILGTFIQQGSSNGTLSLVQTALTIKGFSAVDTAFTSGEHKIACRIYLPKKRGRFPAVIFLHGSGGEGKFSNQYLAEYLASNGIVTLIQDKQGVGKSTGDWTKASFDDLAGDYIEAIAFTKGFDMVNPMQIGIYGHSQGGTLAPLVATRSRDVQFIVAAASVADTIYKQDLYRVERNLKLNGFSESEIASATNYYKQWLDMARTGIGFERLNFLTSEVSKERWFNWVEAPPKDHWIWEYYVRTGNYNSLDYWKKVVVPVLLIYGEHDQIEDVGAYLQNISKVLLSNQIRKDVTTVLLPRAQHNLCIFPEGNEKFFWWYLSPGYESLVAGWILFRYENPN